LTRSAFDIGSFPHTKQSDILLQAVRAVPYFMFFTYSFYKTTNGADRKR
jgi:hypothetical protein